MTTLNNGSPVRLTDKAHKMVGLVSSPAIYISEGVCPAMRQDTPHGYRCYVAIEGAVTIPGGKQKINFQPV